MPSFRIDMLYFIGFALGVVILQLVKDWIIYKHRGRAKLDDPNQDNPPVVTGPQDALAQRLIDLSKKEKRKLPK